MTRTQALRMVAVKRERKARSERLSLKMVRDIIRLAAEMRVDTPLYLVGVGRVE